MVIRFLHTITWVLIVLTLPVLPHVHGQYFVHVYLWTFASFVTNYFMWLASWMLILCAGQQIQHKLYIVHRLIVWKKLLSCSLSYTILYMYARVHWYMYNMAIIFWLKGLVLQLAIQLGYAYNQILSVLTNTQLQQIFEKSPGFDLRHLLQGSEKFVDNILNMTDTDPSLIFAGVSHDHIP